MKRQFFVVANPASGSTRLEDILNDVIDFLNDRKYKYEVFLTSKKHNAWKIVEKNFDPSFTDLLIIGGDGTINEAVNGLQYDVPVSIIPNGTGNDFVKNYPVGHSIDDYLKVLETGVIHTIDLGLCNGRKFVNGVGVGFDGQIVADMLRKKSFLKGPTKYYYYVLRILATYKARSFKFVQDKSAWEKDLILLCVANGTTFGGSFKLTPDAEINDTILDVCEIGKISGLRRFLNIHRLKEGTHNRLPEVKLSRCKHLSIEENPLLEAHIDGEYFGHPPFEFGVLPNALRLRMLR
ncbi:MAG: diacylglycerol kinase family lipid kinase [Marinoscillum sp.]|uniref:diacylglycerol/lipid kinase family protein n=1 Tax=Marinoscillum sp. TaxID=2024838 RepID=UPI0032FE24F4